MTKKMWVKMFKHPLSVAMMLSLVTNLSFALEPLDDNAMSATTAQDGIKISINNGGSIGLENIKLIQKDVSFQANGENYNKSAAVSVSLPSGKIMFCSSETASQDCSTNTEAMTIEINTDGGTGTGAFLDAKISTNAKSIYIPIKTVSLLGGIGEDNLKRPTWTTEIPLLEMGEGVKIEGKTGLKANLQLGSQPQGSMIYIALANTVGTDIKLNQLNLKSLGALSENDSQISTDMQVLGLNASLDNGKTSTGTGIDIDGADGIVISKKRATIKEITLNNTVLGSSTLPVNSSTFNGLQNASIGNLSIKNISINNLKLGVNGM